MELSLNRNEKLYHHLVNVVMIGFAVICFARLILEAVITSKDCTAWGLNDFLINYQAGFVRRGLLGEILYQLTLHGFDPRASILCFSLICFFCVTIFLFHLFKKENIAWWILPMTIFLGGGDIIRKDFFLYFCLILIIAVFRKRNYNVLRFFLINILACVAILTHEVFFFICIPFLMLYEYRNSSLLKSILFFSPIIITEILCSIYKGSSLYAQTIHDSWIPFMPSDFGVKPSASVESLCWTFKFAMDFNKGWNFAVHSYGISGYIGRPIEIFLIFYFLINYLPVISKKNKDSSTLFGRILVFQFLSLSLLFAIFSCDYGRLSCYWSLSSFVMYIMLPAKESQSIFPLWYNKIVDRSIETITTLLPPKAWVIYLLMLIIGMNMSGFDIFSAFQHSVIGHYIYFLPEIPNWINSL